MINFHIRSPWFMSAGKQYGWGSEYSQEGIGLNKARLQGVPSEIVEICDNKGVKYRSTLKDLHDFYTVYSNSSMVAKGGIVLLIFPRSLFSIERPKEFWDQFKTEEDPQLSLI